MKRAAVVVALVLAACSSSTDEICNDGIDNDHANGTDCADPKCAVGAACGPNGLVCSAGACTGCSGNGGISQTKETICGDGIDNDCDGRVDCDDPDCQPTGSTPGGLCDPDGHRCGAPDASGHATCGTTGGGGGGGGGGAATLGTLRLVGSDFYVLGTEGSGFQEQALLTFAVTSGDGLPYASLTVSFAHVSQGGSFVGSSRACSGIPAVCTASAVTDGNGHASVLLTSGRRYAVLAVTASATAQGTTRTITAGGFTVVGARPNGAHLSMDCGLHNIPALTHHDCVYSNYCSWPHDTPDPCTVKLADRHGVAIGVPTYVSFRAEAGTVPATTVTPAFDATRPALDQPEVGHADFYFETCNSPLPWDVEPLTTAGERSFVTDSGCGTRTRNPRDGIVTVIAMVQGEEGFVDLNQNGRHDLGEPFVDLGEPFVDVDDDGVHEDHEWYLDANGNGRYDGPNGVWDADTVLWTQMRLVYTGYPARLEDGLGNELLSRIFPLGTPLASTPPAPTPPPAPQFLVHAGPPPTMQTFGFFFSDENFNPLTSLAEYSAASTGAVKASLLGPSGTADSIGTTFRQWYCEQPAFAAATCRDGPVEQACISSPCYVVWDLGSCSSGRCQFQYGNPGQVSVTGVTASADTLTVWVGATINDVTANLPLSGTCQP